VSADARCVASGRNSREPDPPLGACRAPLVGFRDHRAVDTGEALSRDLGFKLGSQFQIPLRAEFECRPLLGTLPHPVPNVVLGDDEVLAEIVAAADYDVAVRVAGVEMVDRYPIEPRAEVLRHLSHHIPGEGPQVGKAIPILRGDDEAELMSILAAAGCEHVAVCTVRLGTVQSAAHAIACGAVPLQVTDMGVGGPAAELHARDPRLDDDAAHPLSRPPVNGRLLELIGRGLAPANPAAPSLLGALPSALRTPSAAQPE
jgi:hypothetical protein